MDQQIISFLKSQTEVTDFSQNTDFTLSIVNIGHEDKFSRPFHTSHIHTPSEIKFWCK